MVETAKGKDHGQWSYLDMPVGRPAKWVHMGGASFIAPKMVTAPLSLKLTVNEEDLRTEFTDEDLLDANGQIDFCKPEVMAAYVSYLDGAAFLNSGTQLGDRQGVQDKG